MTTKRQTTLKLIDIQSAELPTTMPAIVQSSAQRLSWQREIMNASDERDLIDAQIQSAERTCATTKTEAVSVRDARITYANSAMDREFEDADKILAATSTALRARQSDLGRVIAGLGAALDAISSGDDDGIQG